MELEQIYQKYTWLKDGISRSIYVPMVNDEMCLRFPILLFHLGIIYTPMVNAAIGKRSDIDPMDYFEAVITINVKEYNQEPAYAKSVVKQNVGYWAGYFNMEAMQKVKEVYGAAHPIFG